MTTQIRRTRCGLCREEGHNYRTCTRVEIIHSDLIHIFKRIILENTITTLEEGLELRCRWLEDYSIIAFRALARKHQLNTTLSKREYYGLFKRLYFTIAFQEIQVMIGDQIMRDIISRMISTRDNETNENNYTSYWVDSNVLQMPISFFPIELIEADQEVEIEEYNCPICYEEIKDPEKKIKIGCGHRFCESCICTYLTVLKEDNDNKKNPEYFTPMCALCRRPIISLEGDINVLNEKFRDKLSFI